MDLHISLGSFPLSFLLQMVILIIQNIKYFKFLECVELNLTFLLVKLTSPTQIFFKLQIQNLYLLHIRQDNMNLSFLIKFKRDGLLFSYLQSLCKLIHIWVLNNCKLKANAQVLHLFIPNLLIPVMAFFRLLAHRLAHNYLKSRFWRIYEWY